MAGTATHLVDCVLPAVPVRQYVLAFPYELLGLAATRPEVLRALPAHLLGRAAPSREELQETLRYIYARVIKWLARGDLFRAADASNEAPSFSVGEAMILAGMQRGTLETAKETGVRAEHELAEPPPRVAVHERLGVRPDGLPHYVGLLLPREVRCVGEEEGHEQGRRDDEGRRARRPSRGLSWRSCASTPRGRTRHGHGWIHGAKYDKNRRAQRLRSVASRLLIASPCSPWFAPPALVCP